MGGEAGVERFTGELLWCAQVATGEVGTAIGGTGILVYWYTGIL